MRNFTTKHLGEPIFCHWVTTSLFLLIFLLFSLQNAQAQCLSPACAAGFDPPDYIIDVCDTDCNFVGKNCGSGNAGVACSDVIINVPAMAACLGVDLANCPEPVFNFSVFQGCGENATSNTEWYYFNPSTMLCESNMTQADGSIALPVSASSTTITLTVCTTSNNQSYGNFNFTGCCQLDVTCPDPGPYNLDCVGQLPSADNPFGQFTALGGVVVESCNPTNITISDQQSGLGCTSNPLSVTRTFTITDPVTQETVSC
ncbi:MAG: hypothetical protein IT258_20625, partial [Saprospiraceae bacterium]|nr:hypothetical protein [Saprospiraceae bacterium]